MSKKGFKHSEESKRKMSESRTGKRRGLREFCKRGHLLEKYKKIDNSGYPFCSECKRERGRKYHKDNPEKHKMYWRKSRLKLRYGLSIQDFDNMIIKQDCKCLICFDELKLGTVSCCVDHDHNTGKVRGILCSKCNSAIGLLREDQDILLSALEYISRSQQVK